MAPFSPAGQHNGRAHSKLLLPFGFSVGLCLCRCLSVTAKRAASRASCSFDHFFSLECVDVSARALLLVGRWLRLLIVHGGRRLLLHLSLTHSALQPSCKDALRISLHIQLLASPLSYCHPCSLAIDSVRRRQRRNESTSQP